MDRASLIASCECCRINVLDEYLASSDVLVAKALSISEVAQIARIEDRMRRYLLGVWNVRSKEAAQLAGKSIASGGTLKQALSHVNSTMSLFKTDVSPKYAESLRSVYKLARTAGHKKAIGKYKGSLSYVVPEGVKKAHKSPKLPKPKKPQKDIIDDKLELGADVAAIETGPGKTPALAAALLTPKTPSFHGAPAAAEPKIVTISPVFDLVDEKAIIAIQRQELIWIGNAYEGIAEIVRDAVTPKMLKGLSKEEAGRMVREAIESKLGGIQVPRGPADEYFEGLAANAVTNARVQGQLESFGRIGVTQYEIVNPMDDRTTPICALLNGTVFTMEQGTTQLNAMRSATTPEAYKNAHPWINIQRARSLKSKGAAALADAGQAFPPYHFRCRSTVDVTEGYSYADLEPMGSD